MFEEGGEVPPVEPVNIQHSQVERPIIPSSPEEVKDPQPSTSETSGEETVASSAGKSPRLTPKPGELHDKRQRNGKRVKVYSERKGKIIDPCFIL